jgi:hypothetical protein
VDDADFDWLSQWKWHAFRGSRNATFYAVRTEKTAGKKRTVWMHREIAGTPAGMVTDHIDGNGLNNQRANLRAVSHTQNMVNNSRHVIGSSRYRGVSWHKRQRVWIAQITVSRKNIYIGKFSTEEAAHAAYVEAREVFRAGEIMRA